MRTIARVSAILMVTSLLPVAAPEATAAPFAGLHTLAGRWACTYRAGAIRMAYGATYVPDRDGHTMREIASWTGGGDEELIGYDQKLHRWTAAVFEDDGGTTILRGAGSDPDHIAYRSVYPDASIAETIDRVSPTAYAIHATVRSGATTIRSVDTCVRTGR